jgi:predicted DNA-binding transcriptional regulator AlpA
MRKPAVLAATGWSNSTLYTKISEQKLPKGTKLVPEGRTVVWFEDEVEALQKAATSAKAKRPEIGRKRNPDRLRRPGFEGESKKLTRSM